ncbi:MAG TPA: hypothetical protein VGM84_09040 [Steroidobacteraceae bacterium]|jgi:hypothetical protein
MSNHAIAEENELSVLKVTHVFGHTRRTEVARAIWSKSSARMADKMAQRTVRRLIDNRQLVDTPNTLGGHSLILARSGAARLRDCGIDAHQGGDMSSIMGPQFFHRTLGTCYLIHRQTQGHTVYGEHAIAIGQSFVGRQELERRFGKVPDGLVLVSARDHEHIPGRMLAEWVEVESSRKSFHELSRVLDVAWQLGGWLDDAQTVILDRVVFVYDQRQAHEQAIIQALQRYLPTQPPGNTRELLASVALARCRIRSPLIWGGCEEIDGRMLLDAGKLRMKAANDPFSTYPTDAA